jgi:DNA-binding HxlR family transcriptional regulator
MAVEASCRIDAVLKIIGDRWTLGIIHALSAGPRRTLDLFSSFNGLSTKTMTQRLRMLQRNGLIARKSYPVSPPRVEYSLTEKGNEILPLIDSIAKVYGVLYEIPHDMESAHCRFCEGLGEVATAASKNERRPAEPRRDGADKTVNDAAVWSNRKRKWADVTLL